ncbi:hypothetical protein V9L05_22640 (plasmid) [Bernardetia sp. Wsw4-3y2]|uniref:hypothetical protein n=1 Tax=unclassified Bernardetia TaxID=2647129 RepID=UPI0030CDD18F
MKYYNLVAECKGYESAHEFCAYFRENVPVLSNGTRIASEANAMRRGDGYWIACVSFEGLFSFDSEEELEYAQKNAVSATVNSNFLEEAVSEIFSLLSVAPSYMAAAFGVDAIDAFSQMAIEEIILQNASFGYLFLNDTAWERLGEPKGFEVFSEGYYWNPN